jgi:cyanophycin synthetase
MRELGRVAARYFDEVIVREDRNNRGRERGETAMLIMEGLHQAAEAGGARAGYAEIVVDEMDAARRALDRSRPGDIVVLCVDYATEVYRELEARRGMASPAVLLPAEGNGHVEAVGGDPDFLELSANPT